MRLKKIFTITVVNGDPYKREVDKHLRSRCWGYYFNRKDSEEAIQNNVTDISEMGYYKYAVLSEQGEGPLPDGEELQWYEFIWNWKVPPRKHDNLVIPEFVRTKKIKKPKMYEHILFGGL